MKRQNVPPSHFDAVDALSDVELKDAHKKADDKFESEHDKELELEKSTITVPNQEWVLVSFVGKSCAQKTDIFGMKIHGAFPCQKTAKEHLKRLGKLEENKYYDIYILEMYSWAVVPPDPNCIEDQEYHDDKLNELISEHKKEKYRSKEVFDTRKEKLKQNPDINQYNRNKEVLSSLNKTPFTDQQKLPAFTLEENKDQTKASDVIEELM
jgi:hypothetical protein